MRYRRYGGGVRGLRGKGVLVSGGSSGIGLAAAERFLDEGCRVFLGGLAPEGVAGAVERLKARGKVEGMACDVSRDREAAGLAEAARDYLGAIDVLANNAGI